MLVIVDLTFMSENLNGSLPGAISLAICIFSMYIIWLKKWTWAKLYKTVHLPLYTVSCLNCTVLLSDTSITKNLKRHFNLNCSHPLA